MKWYYKKQLAAWLNAVWLQEKMLKFAILICLGLAATAHAQYFERRSPDPDQVAKLLQLMSSLKVDTLCFLFAIITHQTKQTRDPMMMQRRGWMPMFRRSTTNFDDYYDSPMIELRRAQDGEFASSWIWLVFVQLKMKQRKNETCHSCLSKRNLFKHDKQRSSLMNYGT